MTINATTIKQLLSKITPTIAVSVTIAVLAVIAAFGVTVSAAEQAAVIGFIGATVFVLTKHLTAETLVGLVTATLAVAVTFGLPVTSAQTESIIALTVVIAGLVLGKAGIKVTVARKEAKAAAKAAALSDAKPAGQ